jgi:hypothetical protein
MRMASSAMSPSSERRAEVRMRLALGAAAALLVVGLVAFVQTRTDTGPAPTPASPVQKAQPDPVQTNVLGEARGGKLVPAARRVASTFAVSALRRENLADSWDLATTDLRGPVTRSQWLAGEMPIPPYPVRSLASTKFTVISAKPDRVLLQLLVLPPVGNKQFEPLRYDMTLEKHGGRWLVSYLVPYAPLPVQKDG